MRLLPLAQSLFGVAVGAVGVVALAFGLPSFVGWVLPEYEAWVTDHMPQIVSVLGLVFLTTIILWTSRGTSKYKPGEDPLAMARIMVAFGRRRMAIRYLESVPRDHPRATQVQMQIHKLRQDT